MRHAPSRVRGRGEAKAAKGDDEAQGPTPIIRIRIGRISAPTTVVVKGTLAEIQAVPS